MIPPSRLASSVTESAWIYGPEVMRNGGEVVHTDVDTNCWYPKCKRVALSILGLCEEHLHGQG